MEPEKEVADPQTEIEDMADHLRDYISTRRELMELKVLDKVFAVSGKAVSWSVIIFIGAVFIVMLSIAGALWINVALSSRFLGFFIISGFYLLLGTVLFIGREKLLEKPVSNRIIDHIANEEEEDDTADKSEDQQSRRSAETHFPVESPHA